MKTSILDKSRRLAGACVLVLAGAGLAACGSDNDRPAPPDNPTPPPSTIDTFFAYVEARVGALLDNDEPIDIEAVTATTPDTTEPEPLK